MELLYSYSLQVLELITCNYRRCDDQRCSCLENGFVCTDIRQCKDCSNNDNDLETDNEECSDSDSDSDEDY